MLKLLKEKRTLKFALVLSLTLGLAPFFPEPHIWGKIKWIAGGGEGMAIQDYFDVMVHGTPWVILCLSLIAQSIAYLRR